MVPCQVEVEAPSQGAGEEVVDLLQVGAVELLRVGEVEEEAEQQQEGEVQEGRLALLTRRTRSTQTASRSHNLVSVSPFQKIFSAEFLRVRPLTSSMC